MVAKFDIRTNDEIVNSLAQGLPKGRLFQAAGINGSNLRRLLTGLAIEIERIEDKLINGIYESYFINENKDGLLEVWESILGIPDSCFTIINKTRDERIEQVLAKLRMQYVVTEQDFIDFASILGFTVTIEQGIEIGTFPMTFPFPLGSPKELRFTMLVNLEASLAPLSFPYTFPLEFSSDSSNLIVCLFEKMKPANTSIIYNYIL
jgi:uncharacterized protein YmfQ (DUF2313 family)